jgi:hypothetical protein
MQPIDTIWAFLSVDETGNEGLAAASMGEHIMPLVAADEKRLDIITPIAAKVARTSGRRIRLVKFTQREVLREFGVQ